MRCKRLRFKPNLFILITVLALLFLTSACSQQAATPEPAPGGGEAKEEAKTEPEVKEEATATPEPPAEEQAEATEEATAEPEAEATEEAAATEVGAAAVEEAAAAFEGTFTYWGGLIFSDTANQMLVDRVEQWGSERGIDVEVVMINQNETVQRVSAAIEAGTMPDALDMGRDLMLLLSQNDQLEPVDELFDEIGAAHGGWLDSASSGNDPADFGGHRYGIPFGTAGNVLYRRTDVLEAAGFTEAPATWEEMAEQAKAAQAPPEHYGMGFALSNVGDGNLTTTMLQSWGGRIADDAGTTCTIDSPETRSFLEWITTAYNDGLFPPGATTWDGAGDNTAYQSGNALFIANPGSVYLYLRDNDPDLGEATQYSALPAGPKMRLAPQGPNFRVIPATTKSDILAKDLLAYLADDEFMQEYFFNAIYGPVLNSQVDFPIFKEGPVHIGLLDLALNGTKPGFPDVNNAAFAEYQTNFLTPKMIQRIVVDGLSIDDAIAETQTACQAIYDKYKPTEEAIAAFEGTFTYWGGLIFSDTANQMLVDRIEQWGSERGIDVEAVMINQNETVQRVSAAIEAGTMPDALDMGRDLMLLLSQNGQLEPVDQLFDDIGDAHGGWLDSAAATNDPADFGGHRYGIPFGTAGNVLYRRTDVLEAAGFTEAPATWEEMAEQAKAAQAPPEHYGMGFALSNVGDGNLTTTMLQSWGGRIADDAGTTCTIDSPETRSFLEWITTAYNDGLFPPGATTWDGAGDNTAYQSGNALFIANPGSVYLYLRDNDPDLGAATQFSALPAGPKMRLAPQGPNLRVIPKTSKSVVLARDLLAYLADDEFMQEYFFNAIYGPVLNSQVDFPIFKEGPVHIGLLDLALNGTKPGFPDVNNAAFAEYQTNFLTPKMIQRIVVDGLSIDDAIAETQTACQAIYDKYKQE